MVQALKFCGAGVLAGQTFRLVGEFRETAHSKSGKHNELATLFLIIGDHAPAFVVGVLRVFRGECVLVVSAGS